MNDDQNLDQLKSDVDTIKRLLVVMLMRDGASQTEIAFALGVNQSTVSRMFSSIKPKKSE